MSSCSERQHRITIYKPITVPDGYGGMKTSWELYKTRWAQVMPPAFREQQAQGTPMSREQIQIKLQPPDTLIQRGWKLGWQGNSYSIDTSDNTYRERTILVAHTLNPGM
mgnify:CR=1 FL=1